MFTHGASQQQYRPPGVLIHVLCWQDGTEAFDSISAAVIGDDASVVLAGYSSGNWSGIAPGRAEVAAVKLDANANELWRWQVFESKNVDSWPK